MVNNMPLDNLPSLLQELSSGNNLGEEITLVGATKTIDVETINKAISMGLNVVAENRVQEFNLKHEQIVGARQHFIGHLQTNKVKYLVGKVELIHSVDSVHLAKEIDRVAKNRATVQDVLVEVNVGGELSKSGVTLENAKSMVEEIYSNYKNIKIKGLMAMLPKSDNEDFLSTLCLKMRNLYESLKATYDLTYLSMGMSNDYKIAIKNGSNMIRLGRTIFGERVFGGN